MHTSELRTGADHRPSVWKPVALVTTVGVVATAALALVAGMLAQRAGVDQATRSLEDLTRAIGATFSPFLDATPSPASQGTTTVTSQASALLATGSVVRIRICDANGRVIWSDDPELVGQVSPLSPAQRHALRDGNVQSQVTQGGAANRYGHEPLLEAFVRVGDVHGTPLLVDVFAPYHAATAAARSTWLPLVPVSVGTLIALQLVQVPLCWHLARRVRSSRAAEAELRRAAADASDTERRRIAREVHDHILQDLTATTYDLDGARLRRGRRSAEDQLLIIRTASRLRSVIADMRTLLVSLMPARLPEPDLERGLRALGTELAPSGTQVIVRVTGAEAIPEDVAALLLRCAQEALRNAAHHGEAATVEVSVRCEHGNCTLVVDDDGRGFDEARLAESHATGHLGLRALGDLVADAGGGLSVESAPGQGARVEVTVPLKRTPFGLAGFR